MTLARVVLSREVQHLGLSLPLLQPSPGSHLLFTCSVNTEGLTQGMGI